MYFIIVNVSVLLSLRYVWPRLAALS